MDGSGQGIAAQRFDATGATVDGVFVVNERTTNTQGEPDVIGLDDGRFVVSWRDFSGTVDGSGDGTLAQIYSASGERQDGQFILNETIFSTQSSPELAALPGGNFVSVYTSVSSATTGDLSGDVVFQQVFGDPADFSATNAPILQGAPEAVTLSESDVNAGFVRLDTDKTIAFSDLDGPSFDGGSLTLSVDNILNRIEQAGPGDDETQDLLGLVSGDVGNGDVTFTGLGVGDTVSVDGVAVGTISSAGQTFIIDFNANSTIEAVEAILGNLAYSNLSDGPETVRRLALDVEDATGQSSPTEFIDVTITPVVDVSLTPGAEFGVNTFTEGEQTDPVVAELAGGGFVVAWTSTNQDDANVGSGTGIFAQVYTATGVPLGRELQVNSTVASTQNVPAVAAAADGTFLVVWQGINVDNAGDNDFGILGQRFAADGTPIGSEFVINTTVAATQFDPEVAAFEDGGFVVTYVSDSGDGSIDSILSQRLDATGSLNGTEQVVSVANFDGNQSQPAVATLVDSLGNNAGHVIVFTTPVGTGTGDGDDLGVFAQRYDTAGVAVGAEFQVNTSFLRDQSDASVVGLTGGGFVIVWTDEVADGSTNGVFAQIYDVNGAAVGSEFRVNTDIVNSESDAQVTAMSDGGFLVSWTAGSNQDGSSDGVYAQRLMRRVLESTTNFL